VDEACDKLDLDGGGRASHRSCRLEAGEHGAGGVARGGEVDEACDQLDPVTPFSAPVVSLPIFIPVLLLLRRRRQLSQSDAIRSDTGTTLNSVRSFFLLFFLPVHCTSQRVCSSVFCRFI
jgi:hypothetical protein